MSLDFIPQVCLVGTGNVASHMAPALASNHELLAIASRSRNRAAELSRDLKLLPGANAGFTLSEVRALEPPVILISVADKALNDVVAAIGSLKYNPLVLHTSGTIDKEVLSPISPRTGILYPLQTFTKGEKVDLSQVPFFIEASSADDLAIIRDLANEFSTRVYEADAEHRRALHIAGVFTSNFTNVLLECVEHVLAPAGYGLDVVRPLVEATISKAYAITPHEAQTGPAIRGDKAVIARQQASLPEYMRPAYAELTKLIQYYHEQD